jgi:hypothetical protein
MQPIQETSPAAPIIADDLTCAVCDYNLRGLDAAQRCPECGNEISLSLRSDRLEFADPIWLARMSAGVVLLTVAAIAGCLLDILWGYPGEFVIWSKYGLMQWLGAVSGPASSVFGVWLLTCPEHLGARRVRRSGLRIPLRVVGSICFLWYSLREVMRYWGSAVFVIQSLLSIATIVLLYRSLLGLARRESDHVLERHTPVVMFVTILLSAATGLAPALASLFEVSFFSGNTSIRVVLFVEALVGAYNAVLLWMYCAMLHRAIRAARHRVH